jgi:hypothetical protein
MKRTQPLSILIVFVIFCSFSGMISGCARGLAYADVADHIPPVQPGYARVYFYSQRVNPSDVVFKFSIDGERNGQTGSFQALYVDRPAGSIKIIANTGGIWPGADPKDITLNLKTGETRYIQAGPDAQYAGLHFIHIRLILVDPDQAISDLNKCFYVGPILPG